MIRIPLADLKKKIKDSSGMSDEELSFKIKKKMDTLSGLISEEGASYIIANEIGIKLFEEAGKLQIKNILIGMRNVEVLGKVTRVNEQREFKREGRAGKVGSFVMGDETGSIRAVLWGDQSDILKSIKEGDVIKIQGGYAKENNMGFKEVHLSEKSKLEINPEGETIEGVKERPLAERKEIKNLEQGSNVELLGTIVQVYDIRFYEVCPKCKSRVRQREEGFVCEKDGVVKPDYSYVLNVLLDDGTGNIRSVFFRNQVEKLTGLNEEQLKEMKEKPDKFEDVKHELLGKIIKVNGRVTKNEMFDRLEFITQDVDVKPKPEEEIKRLEEKKPEKKEPQAEEAEKPEPEEKKEMPGPKEEKTEEETPKPEEKSKMSETPGKIPAEEESEEDVPLPPSEEETPTLDDIPSAEHEK